MDTTARDTSGNVIQVGNPALNPQFDYTKPIDVNTIKPATPFTPPAFNQPAIPNATNEAISGLNSAISSLNTKGQAQTQAEAAVGLPQLNERLNKISEQLGQADSQALKNQEQALATGTTLSFAAGEAQRVARNDAIQRMSLAASSQELQGKIAQARDLVTKAVDAQFAPAENYIKYFGTLYSALQNDMTESEKFAAQSKQKELETKVNDLKDAKKFAVERLIAADEYTPTRVEAVLKSGSVDEVYAALKGTSSQSAIDKRYKEAQIASLVTQATDKKKATGAIEKVANVSPNSPTYIQDIIAASKGGQVLTGEQSKPIVKALTVVGQIEALQQTLENVDTGPLIGILKSNNPWDVKAGLVKAQLQAIIPNLARGVYGEVGVLTDNDIINYSKTLGNLRSPKQLSDLTMAMTLKTIQRSVNDNLEVLASAGRDVSGFKNLQSKLTNEISSIEKRIGVKDLTADDFKTLPLNDFLNQVPETTEDNASFFGVTNIK